MTAAQTKTWADVARIVGRHAEHAPDLVKRWVCSHPAHLMLLAGWDVEPFQLWAMNALLSGDRELLWLAPRGSGKSTVAVLVASWLAVADPEVYQEAGIPDLFPNPRGLRIGPSNIRIAMVSNSVERAGTMVSQARKLLSLPVMVKVFGTELEGKRWSNTVADTTLRNSFPPIREGTFNAMGLGSRVAGLHAEVIVCDDFVTSEWVTTPAQRAKLENFFSTDVRPCLETPHGRIWVTGTRYAPGDWYGTLIAAAESGAWQRVLLDRALAEDPDGAERSYWETKAPLRDLLRQRTLDPRAFSLQMQQDASVMEGTCFTLPMTQNQAIFDDLPAAERAKARFTVALDPAVKTGARNDFSVFTVLAYVTSIPVRFYVVRVVRGQWSFAEQVDRAVELFRKYRPTVFAVEAVGGLEFLSATLRQHGIPVRSVMPGTHGARGKKQRVERLLKLFEGGQVFIAPPSLATGTAPLIEEMLAYPGGRFDDCVDSLTWALTVSTSARGRVFKLTDRQKLGL